MMIYVLPPPRSTYGEWRLSTKYSPTLRSRDYKDPILVIEIDELIPTHKDKWICEEKVPIPLTKDECCPAITATYEYASFANMMSTGHFPRMGVLEIGHYEYKEIKQWKNNGEK